MNDNPQERIDPKVTQVVLEVIGQGNVDVRHTQVVLEVIGQGNVDVRHTQVVLEVLITSIPLPPVGSQIISFW
jgi:hypothetical protein